MPSSKKERKVDRDAKKKLTKKLNYSKAFAAITKPSKHMLVSSSGAAENRPLASSSSKKLRRTLLSDAYSRAGVSGSDLATAGKRIFEQALFPKSDTFFSEIHHKTTHVEARGASKHHREWITREEVKSLLESGKLTPDDVVLSKFTGTELENKLYDVDSWQQDLDGGWSIRFLHPQVENPKLWRLCTLLEAFCEVSVGINVCWVPKGAQGYAPRYDETDAFILQVEGQSCWSLFKPMGDATFPELAVEPSTDFVLEDLEGLVNEREVVLNAGDTLYFPRGYVYTYKADESADSIHLCLSLRTNLMTWADVIERALKKAVEAAKMQHLELRESVPRGFSSFMGAQYIDRKDDDRRAEFELKVLKLLRSKVLPAVDVDAASDDLVGGFMYDRLRPAREDDDDDFEGGEGDDEGSDDIDESKLSLKSEVELQVVNSARICVESGMAVVRHCMKNTRLIHGVDDRGIEFDLDDAPTVEAALNNKDGPFSLASLPEVLVEEGEEPEEDGGRVRVASIMLHEGILRLVRY